MERINISEIVNVEEIKVKDFIILQSIVKALAVLSEDKEYDLAEITLMKTFDELGIAPVAFSRALIMALERNE